MKRISVVEHNPDWAGVFTAAAASELQWIVGSNFVAIHHIGSTSIPGIYAKPVIDMLMVVLDINALDAQSAQFESIGYEPRGEFGIPSRRYFRRDDSDGVRTHQIHAFQTGSPHIARHIAFRDYLCAHPVDAMRYSDLKRSLADKHPFDMEAYMVGKDGLIKELENKAIEWAADGRPH